MFPRRRSGRVEMKIAGLGVAALSYIAFDYLRVFDPWLHDILRPLLWGSLAIAAAIRLPFYPFWSLELRNVLTFLACLVFMITCLIVEAISVQFVTSVLGLDWHESAHPLPDTGQWLLLSLNQKLPTSIVQMLRSPIIGLHHYLMLFIMLCFSVLFGCVKAPGLGLGARYLFTMGVGRLLRVLTFVATILPSARPWCAKTRFKVPQHPHPWAQKYYVPYATDPNAISHLLRTDTAYATVGDYPEEYIPDWGRMQFLVNFLRPLDPNLFQSDSSWFSTLKRTGGGCNDLVYSGHILVSVLTAMAWSEAYPGWTSVGIWILVLHSAQREIRERHHYSVDVVAGIYVGILLWRISSFIWSNSTRFNKLKRYEQVEAKLVKASKDGDMESVRTCVEQLKGSNKLLSSPLPSSTNLIFPIAIITCSLALVLLAFIWTADG